MASKIRQLRKSPVSTAWSNVKKININPTFFTLQEKQGRIHGYPSRARVGRGSDRKADPNIWAGAVTRKSPVNAKSENDRGPTNRPTDQPTN